MGGRTRIEWHRSCGVAAFLSIAAMGMTPGLSAQDTPPLPTDVPVWMVGSAEIDGAGLSPYSDVTFAIGRTGKDGPLGVGEQVQAGALQSMSLRPERRDGRDVWVRSFSMARAGDPTVLAEGEIVLDRRTLAPLSSSMRQGENESGFEYDWTSYEIRSTAGPIEKTDLLVLEAAAHETWVGAIDWSVNERAMIPTVLAGGGGKWWAVPRVAGREDIDLGDGRVRSAWVVEMDWWGMGVDSETFTPGGGVNGSAGAGGKYWVLVEPEAGLPRVVRVQTEVDPTMDSVVQIQAHEGR